jgi:DNA primase
MGIAHNVDELKGLLDPLAVYQEYVRLTRKGRRRTGLCPFHREKTPSFSVDSENGLFYCFGCHKGGDLIQFVQEVEGCSFPEALEILARKAGVSLSFSREAKGPAPDRKERLRKLLESSAAFYHAALLSASRSSSIWNYARKRGITEDTAKALRLGFAPPEGGLLAHLKREGYQAEDGQEAGLLLEKNRGEWTERFRNRLLFPIQDVMGRTVGFGGRALGDEEPKYLNSPETPIFQKRDTLFGLNLTKSAIREREQALLVEGYMDFLAVYKAGAKNAVASLGTALADGQVKLLKRYAKEVVLNFDRDAAGLAAAQRAIQLLLGEGMRVKVVMLSEGKDPDEFITQKGPLAYLQLVEAAQPFFKFLVDREAKALEGGSVDARMAFLDGLAAYLSAVSDPIERQAYANEVASWARLGGDVNLILKRLAKAAPGDRGAEPRPTAPVKLPVTEQMLVKGCLAFPEAAERLLSGLPAESLRDLAVAPLLDSLRRRRAPDGPEQTSLLAFIQNSFHEVPSEASLEAAVAQVKGSYLHKREQTIQRQLQEASRRKDLELIKILQREKTALVEQIHSLEGA